MHRKGFLLLALICGLIASGSIYVFLSGTRSGPQETLKSLVITKSSIPARSIIKAEQLTTKEIPSQAYPVGGASSIESVVGSVALVNLTAGDSIVNSVIQHSTSNVTNYSGSIALTVPDGKRAVAIPIGLVSGVGFMVKPGDHVDILVTMDIKEPPGNGQTYTSLVAQDVLVLSNGESSSSDKTKVEVKSYTLALTVPQAMAVTLGSEKGSIRLLLRNPVNTDQRSDTPFTANKYLDPNYFTLYK
ncbi:Flp pilus assembly protein CpaB [Desulfitobacterium metallireducens]|uniref:Flp pilus assembly protein CpaB n=1 Tax=Desulfitobacterium metallireducens DSM 15288 TaxID=871968 RepID=W0EBG3_9FIRM|nr:Flp pilus assembly protein CpaB [Desulfitobacterium metallireducens]AHF06873.1 Flp pilus assembly protein CpaB [Desulfitobacterium metallireducens DSM 15288]